MMKIELIPDPISFGYRIVFFKDGEKLTSFNYEILDDLTYRSPDKNPFKGPEFSKNDAIFELSTMIKNDNPEKLSDVTVEEIINEFAPIIKNYKIKKWDGEYLRPIKN